MSENFSIIHQLSKKETAQTIDNLIQNLLVYTKVFPNQKYVLADSFENQQVLAAAKTLQTHFPNLIFTKVAKNTYVESLIQEFDLKDTLIINNYNLLKVQELEFLRKQIGQKLNKDSVKIIHHQEVALRAEKSIWKKFLLYFRYES